MSDHDSTANGFMRHLAVDGPPLAGVIFVFVLIQALSVGQGHPMYGLMILAPGLIVASAAGLGDIRAKRQPDPDAALTALMPRDSSRLEPRERVIRVP